MNVYLVVILAAIAGDYLLGALARRLGRAALDPRLPAEFAGFYDADKYRTSQEYARENMDLDGWSDTVRTAALLAAMGLGFFPWLDGATRALGLGPTLTGLAFLAVIGFISDLLGLPFQVYDTFVLEARYGFNRTTAWTFVADRLKGYALALVVAWPVLAVVLWFFAALGGYAWLAATALTMAVMLGLTYLGPTVILPLFNTFTPLEDGPLRQALQDYARGQGFALDGIFVMDGSKRSTKANAFFTGLGKSRRIALYDTLVQAHPQDEVVAILAHEVGHSRLGHVRLQLLMAVAKTALLFGLLQLFVDADGLFAAFGLAHKSVHAGLFFFLLLYGPLGLLLGVLTGAASRSFEYAADAFAARTTGQPRALAQALKRLSAASLANLTPHPLQVALYYSHPPVLARVEALTKPAAAL